MYRHAFQNLQLPQSHGQGAKRKAEQDAARITDEENDAQLENLKSVEAFKNAMSGGPIQPMHEGAKALPKLTESFCVFFFDGQFLLWFFLFLSKNEGCDHRCRYIPHVPVHIYHHVSLTLSHSEPSSLQLSLQVHRHPPTLISQVQ